MLGDASSKRHTQREGGLVKRAIFLATAALLAMLVLTQMALAQDSTMIDGTTMFGTTVQFGGGVGGPLVPASGGPSILLPAVALLLGSGILTYAILRRR
jgi:hypothetical protein